MPGRLRSSFRSGNLAENLGLLLLKGVAALAEVPRTEDVGLDAVATLLRRDADGNCYAEDTFVVQLKSDSTDELRYTGHELQWLLGQSQPMFIGRISLAEARIRVYPTLRVNRAVLSLHAEQVVLRFGTSNFPAFFQGEKAASWVSGPENSATVWLGEPLLEWKLGDLTMPDWQASTYRVLKRFLPLAREELYLLTLGQSQQMNWSTNDADSIVAGWRMMKGHRDDVVKLAKAAVPALESLLALNLGMSNEEGERIALPICALFSALRAAGVTIDSGAEQLYVAMKTHELKRKAREGAVESLD